MLQDRLDIDELNSDESIQRDFQPVEATTFPRVRLIPLKTKPMIHDQQTPLESISTSRNHHRAHQTVKAKRLDDSTSNVYVPPFEKFSNRTTNNQTYQGDTGSEHVRSFLCYARELL
jgi:hypothetical protein